MMNDHERIIVLERRLEQVMAKLDKHRDQIASRYRTIWRREDEAWARGEELPPHDDGMYEPVTTHTGGPTLWQRFSAYWGR
jgi:hypothetical protein